MMEQRQWGWKQYGHADAAWETIAGYFAAVSICPRWRFRGTGSISGADVRPGDRPRRRLSAIRFVACVEFSSRRTRGFPVSYGNSSIPGLRTPTATIPQPATAHGLARRKDRGESGKPRYLLGLRVGEGADGALKRPVANVIDPLSWCERKRTFSRRR
jgi:hypothetical protein